MEGSKDDKEMSNETVKKRHKKRKQHSLYPRIFATVDERENVKRKVKTIKKANSPSH